MTPDRSSGSVGWSPDYKSETPDVTVGRIMAGLMGDYERRYLKWLVAEARWTFEQFRDAVSIHEPPVVIPEIDWMGHWEADEWGRPYGV